MTAIWTLAWVSVAIAAGGLMLQCVNLAEYPRLRPRKSVQRATIAACIAMRDEVKNARGCIASLLAQPEIATVIVCDDGSEDDTCEEITALARVDRRVVLISSLAPAGKRSACAAAATEAVRRGARALLFTDADVRFDAGAIAALIDYRDRIRVSAVSAWPRTEESSFWDRVFSQTLQVFLLQLLPLHLARRWRDPRIAAANGQLILVDAAAYAACGGHAAVTSIVEDVALAQQLKRAGFSIALADASSIASTGGYGALHRNIEGYGRSLYVGAGRAATFAFGLWQCVAFVVPWLLLARCPLPSSLAIAAGVAARTLTRRAQGLPIIETLAGGAVCTVAALYLAAVDQPFAWRRRAITTPTPVLQTFPDSNS